MTRSKFNASPTTVDGVRFASRREARRYGELVLLQAAGEITHLSLQPKFPLLVNGILVCTYHGDFSYFENGKEVIEDVKGFKTRVYAIKRKLMKALYNITIKEA